MGCWINFGGKGMMIKPMPTLGVLGVATGIVLKEKGFPEIREVLNHLYPGIMTIGCAVMADTAKREIIRQHPGLGHLAEVNKDNYQLRAGQWLISLGETMDIDGPHGTGLPDMEGK